MFEMTLSPERQARAASIVGAGVAIGVAFGALTLLPLESNGVGYVWISVVYAVAALLGGAAIEWRWPGTRRPGNLVFLVLVLTGALWGLLYVFHGEEQPPDDWWARMLFVVFSVLFVAVWLIGAAISSKVHSSARVHA